MKINGKKTDSILLYQQIKLELKCGNIDEAIKLSKQYEGKKANKRRIYDQIIRYATNASYNPDVVNELIEYRKSISKDKENDLYFERKVSSDKKRNMLYDGKITSDDIKVLIDVNNKSLYGCIFIAELCKYFSLEDIGKKYLKAYKGTHTNMQENEKKALSHAMGILENKKTQVSIQEKWDEVYNILAKKQVVFDEIHDGRN